MQQIGAHNVATLTELSELHLYDFGIFIDLAPDEEEKMMLENNIQVALGQQNIELEDAIDVREIKNLKLANQLLKLRRKKKSQRDQIIQQQNIQAQADANMQAQQAAATLEVQKEAAKTQSEAELEMLKSQLEASQMNQEAEIKRKLMELEFAFNMQLREADQKTVHEKDKMKEDRKDKRTKMQASQQSQLIDQRKNDKPPRDFESSNNDTIDGGFDLGAFDPR